MMRYFYVSCMIGTKMYDHILTCDTKTRATRLIKECYPDCKRISIRVLEE